MRNTFTCAVIACAMQRVALLCRHAIHGRASVDMGPGSATQHFMLHRIRDDEGSIA